MSLVYIYLELNVWAYTFFVPETSRFDNFYSPTRGLMYNETK